MSMFAKDTKVPPPPPVAVMPAPRRQLSEAAALAAQHVIDLEQEIERLRAECSEWRHRAERAEATCENLHEEITDLKYERDRYQRHAIELITKLRMSATIIMDAMNHPFTQEIKQKEKEAPPADEQRNAALLDKVEEAITEVKPPLDK